ncbi:MULTISPECIES: HD domain-containing protein [unclassified Deinococcus]|uniref:HD domain-containing protein n=1 Tax=unclassified Deinococcus TaxID=2623546 RepID=UPI001C2F5EE7|nr:MULTISPECIES: HD domain-containing protein [unclassified Deinococcus]MDK2014147.1 HD domain-containing protein [Deinococcus sp. 43]
MPDFPLTDRFLHALERAHHWHAGQYRKVPVCETATVPYLSHLLGVASIALEFGATEDEAIAALLHDALEDGPENIQTDVARRGETREELRRVIRQEFGEQVERLVVGATEDTALIEGRKAPWPERKKAYLQKLIRTENPESAASLLVSAADKLHNARAILADVLTFGATPQSRAPFFDRFNAGQAGTLQYYRLLVRAYRRAPGAQGQPRLQALIGELDRTVTALEQAYGVGEEHVVALPLLRDALPD